MYEFIWFLYLSFLLLCMVEFYINSQRFIINVLFNYLYIILNYL